MSLHVDKVDSLQSEILKISANDLLPDNLYKLVLKLQHSQGSHYAYAVFRSNSTGKIQLATDRPLRGTYTDIDPMGLFSSQTPTSEYAFGAYLKCDPPLPLIYTLSLFDCSNCLLDSILLKRHWRHPKLERIEVDENGIYGSIFKPPGAGPFPAVVDISGIGGGLEELKGVMLASEGFVVFCIAFLQYKTLPKELDNVNLEYFLKAIDFLTSLPYTTERVGLHGLSFGATLVDLIPTKHSKVKAVVSINGPHLAFQIKENDLPKKFVETDNTLTYFLNGVMCSEKQFKTAKPNEETRIHFEDAPADMAYRFVASTDDLITSSLKCTLEKRFSLQEAGHKAVEVDFVNGGHVMNPPYFPHHELSYGGFQGTYIGFGGSVSQHGQSQEKVWQRTIEFFKKHLGTPPKMPEWDRLQHITVSHSKM